jgi:uncharacterized zinc-type alcohol dehydrogenase-like protein
VLTAVDHEQPMATVPALAAAAPGAELEPTSIRLRPVGDHDVLIQIAYVGICHSDIHQVREEWGAASFPMVPGHEIAGVVTQAGSGVKRFSVGDRVGVGCFVDSCRSCVHCRRGEEQFCEQGMTSTYNAVGRDGLPNYGGYSTHIVVDENYVLAIPDSLALDEAAPLLCAGITMYAPLVRWGAGPGTRVAVVGLGGLGHLGVKFARAMGAEVTVLSRGSRKQRGALRLGADHFRATEKPAVFEELSGAFDLVLSTVSASLELDSYLGLLTVGGTLVHVGVPPGPSSLSVAALVDGRKNLSGSFIGGTGETQAMLDFCAVHGIGAEVEVIDAKQANDAYARVVDGDVRYRFVIDVTTLGRADS